MSYAADDLLTMILGGNPADFNWIFDDNNLFVQNDVNFGKFRFDSTGITALTTRVLTVQNSDHILAGTNIAQTFTAKQTFAIQSGASSPVIETATTLTSGLSAGYTSGLWRLEPTLSDAAAGLGGVTALRIVPTLRNASDSAYRGLQMILDIQADDGFSTGGTTISGLDFIVRTTGAPGVSGYSAMRGILGSVQHNNLNQLQTMDAMQLQVSGASLVAGVSGGGAVVDVSGMRFSSISVGTSVVWTNLYLFKGLNPTGAGTVTNLYGLYLPLLNKAGAANSWAIYSLGGQSSHLGAFKFGANTAPTHFVDIAAGTTTVAPLKFTSGTSLTAAIAGVVEMTTDDLFFTITTGAARKAFVLDDGTRLTATRVPFATTNGRLTDDADMTFATDTLTVTGLVVGTTGVTSYKGVATVGAGVPSILATSNLTAQAAAIVATTIYAVPAAGAGMYRVSWDATVTTAASVSSTLGGTNGFQLKFTDADDSVVKTSNPTAVTNHVSAGNTTATHVSGVLNARCKASTNLQYLFDYTSAGTAMQYNLHIRVEFLG